jgi:uncharacterized protein (DUF1684 family)
VIRPCILLIAVSSLLLKGCEQARPVVTDQAQYVRSVEDWRQERLERLKGENGWLNLAGLFWLEEKENSFGSDPANDLVFPGKAAPFCGTLTLKDGKVTLNVIEGAGILIEERPVDSLVLKDDQSPGTTIVRQGDLSWNVIRRGEKFGIRLRDYRHPRIEGLDHIPAYPVDPEYVVEATLLPFSQPRSMSVATPVDGLSETFECPGELHFRLLRKELVLYPFTSERGYFLVFADETTGLETYGAGRFLYADPDSTGRILLDFNKAYNPPCAFSPFATCPMPPKENFLKVAIRAGEKAVHLD